MNRTIVLAGNQNCGKTTLFNAITGANQNVGNWPGVTVDHATGYVESQGLYVVDLPGLYSLSPYSPEEIVSRRFLFKGDYDVIINVVDATHLERSLYLTCELVSFRRPMIIVVNMIDLAEKAGIKIDLQAIQARFGVPVVAISAATKRGFDKLFSEIALITEGSNVKIYDERLEQSIERLAPLIKNVIQEGVNYGNTDFIALSLLQGDHHYLKLIQDQIELRWALERETKDLEQHYKTDIESLVAQERYAFVDQTVAQVVTVPPECQGRYNSLSQRIDSIVTNRFLAIPLFVLIVYMVYYLAVSTIGTMGTDYANDVLFGQYATNAANDAMAYFNAPAWLSGLVVDGIIGGVGAVLGFVPQMIVLFFLLSLLEQSGYMTRVAFILDRLFRNIGLSGLCIFPMVIATGCGVPAVMATNGIDNINEKRITIITTTFMPCSAKLPILAMIAAAFFPESTLVAPSIYFLAIFSIAFTSLVLKKDSAFNEDVSPFVIEMPNYTMPKLRNVLRSTYLRCRSFIIKAGTVIFATVVVIWFLSNFNMTAEGSLLMVEVNDSFLAAIGSVIAFIFIPLGFGSWEAAVAIVTGALAKENVVGTLAVLLGVGEEVAETDAGLGTALHSVFTTNSAALAFLAFNLFSTPCVAALGAMKRQLNSGRLFAFAVVYMLSYAYALAMIIYELGGWICGEVPFTVSTGLAICLVLIGIFLVLRPGHKDRVNMRIPVKQL